MINMKLNPRSRFVCAFVVVLAATVTVYAQSQQQPLSPKEVRELLSGNTFTGVSEKGNGFHVFYKADGTMYGFLFKGPWKGKRDDGTWEVTDEKGHCRQWSQWARQEQQCFKIYRDGERLRYEQTSAYNVLRGSGYMRKGNPENL